MPLEPQAYDYFNRAWETCSRTYRGAFVEGPIDWAPWLDRMKAATEKK